MEREVEKGEDRRYEMHADLCKMLSNPTRLKILEILDEGEKPVGELVDRTGLRQSNISQHLGELRKRGLVENRKDGPNIFYSLRFPEILDACEIIENILFKRLKDDEKVTEKR